MKFILVITHEWRSVKRFWDDFSKLNEVHSKYSVFAKLYSIISGFNQPQKQNFGVAHKPHGWPNHAGPVIDIDLGAFPYPVIALILRVNRRYKQILDNRKIYLPAMSMARKH